MNCEIIQESLVEGVVLYGAQAQWTSEVDAHLEDCPTCRGILQQELELCEYLTEPIPLPPADLVSGVMQRIALQAPVPEATQAEPSTPWAERFAWAASGAAAMFCLERIPSLSDSWLSESYPLLIDTLNSARLPFEIDGLFLAVSALVLVIVQAAMVYQVRSAPS